MSSSLDNDSRSLDTNSAADKIPAVSSLVKTSAVNAVHIPNLRAISLDIFQNRIYL